MKEETRGDELQMESVKEFYHCNITKRESTSGEEEVELPRDIKKSFRHRQP